MFLFNLARWVAAMLRNVNFDLCFFSSNGTREISRNVRPGTSTDIIL